MKNIALVVIFLICLLKFACAQDRVYNIGETAEVKRVSVTINSISPHKEKNRFMNKEGMKYYVIDVTILNGRQEPYEYNAYQFTMLDENDEEHQWCISSIEPKFEGETLAPGMMGRGKLVFGLPENSTPVKIVFDPGYISDDVITFSIKKIQTSEDGQ